MVGLVMNFQENVSQSVDECIIGIFPNPSKALEAFDQNRGVKYVHCIMMHKCNDA